MKSSPMSMAVRQRMSRVLWLLILPVLAGLAACEDTAVEPLLYGEVQGVVRDARTNQPLANVTITTTPATSSIVTDAQGNFALTAVPTGRLTVTTGKADYQSATVAVTVEENVTTTVAILLDKSLTAAPPAAPVRPAPADQATVPGPDVTLEWHPVSPISSDSLKYDVILYEGNTGNNRTLLTNSRDTTVRATELRYSTTYFWQVTIRNGRGGSTRSTLWSFRTGQLPENRYLFVREVDGNSDIYSTNETGTTLQRLTNSASAEKAPQLSPNRDRIAYTSNVTGQYQLYTMNRDGSDQRRVTVLAVEGYHNFGVGYRWSPDGSQLIYAHYNELYRINRDGTGLTLIATAPADRHFRECDWTAQGNRIVVQTIGANVYESELYLMNADGSGRTQLVGNAPGQLNSPSFSIDGRELLYTRDVAGFNDVAGRQLNARIFQQRLDGTSLIDISAGARSGTTTDSGKPAGTNDLHPRYSPDGSKIIFVNTANDGLSAFAIWTVDLDGINRTRLFQNASAPEWR